MRRLLALAGGLLLSVFGPVAFACPVSWDQLVVTEAEHRACIPGTNHPHFEQTWRSDGWNGEGYMRWRVNQTTGEDDDGYGFSHPLVQRPVFISFIARVGSTWWQSHTMADRFKFVMFYPQIGTNPRPTIFNMPIRTADGTYRYRTFGPDLAAGGQGCDQFGNCNHNQGNGYPNHTYKEGPAGHNQWYFIVMSLEQDRTKTYIWSQDGALAGFYAQSQLADAGTQSSWNAQQWRTVRLLAYIEATTAGDANAYMDVGHIRVSRALPAPPAGFVGGSAPPPEPPPPPPPPPPEEPPPPEQPGFRTVRVVAGVDVVPVFGITALGNRSSAVAGFIRIGAACYDDEVFRYRGQSYRRVDREDVIWWRTTPSDNVAAPCA